MNTQAAKWTTYGRWTPDGARVLGPTGRVIFGPPLKTPEIAAPRHPPLKIPDFVAGRRYRMGGFAFLPLLPYLAAALAIAGVLGATYYKGREAGKEVVRAELQPLLTACKGQVAALGDQIAAQNAAVEALRAAGAAKMARARAEYTKAAKSAQTAQNEAARLREAALAPVVSQCPAGEAVAEIRKGLK